METSKSKIIAAALKLFDTKKDNLKKAYDDLQTHSSLVSSSSTISWSHLDSHFTTLHTSLSKRFHLLQSLEVESQHTPPPSLQNGTALPKTPAEQMITLCNNMDGKGLRDYVGEHLKDKAAIEVALQSALKRASDAASMLLDSLDGLLGANALKDDKEVRTRKRSCSFLFKQFRAASVSVSFKVRLRAKRLCVEWKGSLTRDGCVDGVGAMAFLHFVAAYGLLSQLTVNEILTFSAIAASIDELPELYWTAGLTDKVPGLVQKLINRCKHILAVKFVFEFNLADKIPPIPILKAHVNESQKLAKRLSEEGKSLSEITAREMHALKSAIKVIESHNLQSEYPPESLQQRIDQLMNHKANVKYAASAFSARPPPHQQQQSGIKRPRMSAPVCSAAVLNSASSTVHHYQQSHFQSSGLLLEQPPHFQSPGLLPEQQPHFQSSGLLPEQKPHFQSPGLMPEQKPHFQSSGLLPEQQPHFQSQGLLPEQQPHLQSSGLLPKQQPHFQSSGLLPEQQPHFQSSGLFPEQQPHFQSSGLLPEQQPPFQSSGFFPEQQPHFQSSSLLPEHLNPYVNLPTMPYGMKTPTPSIPPYTGASTGPYGLDGVPMGPSGNLGQGGSLPNSSEPLMHSGYYDSVSAYGGYGLQHHYQTYPQ